MMSSSLQNFEVESLVGMAAANAYTKILLSHRSIQRIAVYKYSSPPLLQQRITITSTEQNLIDLALAIRKESHLPFWHAIFAACLKSQNFSAELLGAALFHNGPGEPVDYDREAVDAGVLEALAMSGQKNLGLSSLVQDSMDRAWHLPLLDFHCEITPTNEDLAALVCTHLMPDGFVLVDSGDSYHACGLALLSPDERIQMLGRALLTVPVIDGHYIAHQLQQGANSIRISRGGKAFSSPVVVRAWVPEGHSPKLKNVQDLLVAE